MVCTMTKKARRISKKLIYGFPISKEVAFKLYEKIILDNIINPKDVLFTNNDNLRLRVDHTFDKEYGCQHYIGVHVEEYAGLPLVGRKSSLDMFNETILPLLLIINEPAQKPEYIHVSQVF